MARWTVGEVAVVLGAVLGARSEAMFNGTCDIIARRLGRAGKNNASPGDPLRRLVWGMATGLTDYTRYRLERDLRAGRALTWADMQVIRWARNTDSEEAKEATNHKPPTIEYIAGLLSRPVVEIQDAWEQAGPDRGIRGFGFGGPKEQTPPADKPAH